MKRKLILLSTILAGILVSCASPQPEPVAYNGFESFIPFIPGTFPEDFKIDGADVGFFEEAGESIYWESYQSTEGQIFITRQRLYPHTDDLLTSSLLIQGQPALFSSTVPNIPDVSIPEDAQTMQLYLVTKQGEEVLIEVISNVDELSLIEFGENMIPSICLTPPTDTP